MISFAQGTMTSVNTESKIAKIKDANTGEEYEETYDYLVSASGLRRAWPAVPQSITQEKYLSEAYGHIENVKNAARGVVVIGGGSSPILLKHHILTSLRCSRH